MPTAHATAAPVPAPPAPSTADGSAGEAGSVWDPLRERETRGPAHIRFRETLRTAPRARPPLVRGAAVHRAAAATHPHEPPIGSSARRRRSRAPRWLHRTTR